jgi:ABC-type sugar transport system ATPase subunit
VLDLVRKLKDDGRAVILISHNMQDVAAVADRVVILSAGQKFIDREMAGLTADDLTHLIMKGNALAA